MEWFLYDRDPRHERVTNFDGWLSSDWVSTKNVILYEATSWLLNNKPSWHLFVQLRNGNFRTICKICSNLTIKTSEQHYWPRSCVCIVHFEQISHTALMFPLFDFEQVEACWELNLIYQSSRIFNMLFQLNL